MKITRLEILRVPPCWIWLRVHTDEGVTGLGEPYLEEHPEAVVAEVRRLEPLVVGEDPRRVEYLWRRMYERAYYYRGGPVTMSAISGIDIALWDIKARALGVPVYELLGGRYRDRLPVYIGLLGGVFPMVEPGTRWNYEGSRPPTGLAERDPATWAASARTYLDRGFRALKLHFSFHDGLDMRHVDQGLEVFAAVREEAGPDVDISVDLHHAHPHVGMRFIDEIAPLRPQFVEDPQPIERLDVLRRMVERTSIPIAAGAAWMGKWAFHDALTAGLAVLQPDMLHAGGFTETKKIAAMGEAAYASVAVHCPNSILQVATSVQLHAAIPNFLVQEHHPIHQSVVDGRVVLGAGFLRDPFVLGEDGCIAVPDGPGLGVELDEDGMAEIMDHEWLPARA